MTSLGGGGGGGAMTTTVHSDVSTSSNTSSVFATVPSTDEVNQALSSVRQFVESSPSMLQPGGFQIKMVVSLATDISIWKAVLNNEAVREFIDLVNKAARSISGWGASARNIPGRDAEPSHGSIPLLDYLKRFFVKMKEIAIAVAEKTIEIAGNMFPAVKNSLLLSVLVILVVVVSRVSIGF
uniref:Uncharacterized protein n=1 Tax=Tanacetum cinerariifolium TaxID=118510 RepID=A0A699ITB6_TANCI|nr:hypothetical protein [Tanacetum cinerariifolium]